ncbi:MAG: hypothetical protein MJ132_07085 [Clostridia bacterium]|nr:hypothetical protein [Clostridia bacterium]
MGFFSRKKKEQEEENFFLVEDIVESEPERKAPHALTSNEILFGASQSAANDADDDFDPFEELRQQMLRNAQNRDDSAPGFTVDENAAVPSDKTEETTAEPMQESTEDLSEESIEEQPEYTESGEEASEEMPPQEILQTVPEEAPAVEEVEPEDAQPENNSAFEESEIRFPEVIEEPENVIKEFLSQADSPSSALPPANPDFAVPRTVLPPKTEPIVRSDEDASLLNRCKAYITDDDGNDVSTSGKPIYELESVADILRSESERTLEKLSKNYDFTTEIEITADDLAPDLELIKPKAETEILGEDAPADTPVLSDIDAVVLPKTDYAEAPSDTATIRFTPVKKADGDTDHIAVSTMTRAVDLTGEIGTVATPSEVKPEPARLLETEFEEFRPSLDDNDPAQARAIRRKLSVFKRNAFLQTVGSVFLTLLATFFLLAGHTLIAQPRKALVFCTVLLVLQTVINADMFLSIKSAFGRRASIDTVVPPSAVGGIALGLIAIQNGGNTAYNCYALMVTVLFVLMLRAFSKFWNASSKLGNFRIISNPHEKQAVMMMDDPSTTFAMANNAVEGGALIATPRPANRVGDFMKYSEFSTVLEGRFALVFNISLVLALIIGLAVGAKLGGAVYGVYAATAVFCIAAAPTVFLLNLPVYHAATRLNKKGAMIAGGAAAEHLNKVNAIVVSSRDLFPTGTVSLHDMKVLGDNDLDHVLVRAAALTDAVGSPLTPLFWQIVNPDDSFKLPDSDTVKYEERLGISGWVEDELMFIGNRTLMEAHGIIVPDVEVDRKILRQGYFPIYIACAGKACASMSAGDHARLVVAAPLPRVIDLGVIIRVNGCGLNMAADMICDYFGLYEDSVRVMSSSGVFAYKNAISPVECQSAPAAFRRNPLTVAAIVNCAARVCRSNQILSVLYTLISCIGTVLFAYLTFTGSGMPHGTTMLLGAAVTAVVSYLLYLIKKP